MLPSPGIAGYRLLLVDDEESIVFALRRYFSTRGFAVEVASELEEARSKLQSHPFEIVIADLRLSGPDGFEGLAVMACARSCQPAARTVLLTAYNSPQVEIEVQRLGVDLLMHKPQPLAELARAVTQLLTTERPAP